MSKSHRSPIAVVSRNLPETHGRIFRACYEQFTVSKGSARAVNPFRDICDLSVDVKSQAEIGKSPVDGFVGVSWNVELLRRTGQHPVADGINGQMDNRGVDS